MKYQEIFNYFSIKNSRIEFAKFLNCSSFSLFGEIEVVNLTIFELSKFHYLVFIEQNIHSTTIHPRLGKIGKEIQSWSWPGIFLRNGERSLVE